MTPEERAALDRKISTELRECKAQGRIPVVDSERDGTTICADEHMMAMWRSQGQQCASNPYGTPVYRGNYYGQRVIFSGCNINHWAKQQANKIDLFD